MGAARSDDGVGRVRGATSTGSTRFSPLTANTACIASEAEFGKSGLASFNA